MRVRLLFPDRDAVVEPDLPTGADDLVRDLDLQPVLDAMVPDRRLRHLAPAVLLRPLPDPDAIRWRQRVLADVLADPSGMRALLDVAGRALESHRGAWLYSGRSANSLLVKAVDSVRLLLPFLQELQALGDRLAPTARSDGLAQLYRCLRDELDETYLDEVASLLDQLAFPEGLTARAALTASGLVGGWELLVPHGHRASWRALFGAAHPGHPQFTVAERDDAGVAALDALRDDILAEVAATMARVESHVVGFFRQLQWEAGFHVGCARLHGALSRAGVATCWPDPEPSGSFLSAAGLVPAGLALRTGRPPVPSDLAGPRTPLAVVTGANDGGKTTWLRAVGCAQLLLQAGVFVPATRFRSSAGVGVHTHFRGGQEDDLRSGRLEEELRHLSVLVDRCHRGDLVLMNEPFTSTDELAASALTSGVVDAMVAHGVRVLLVTHHGALARHYLGRDDAAHLVAGLLPDGTRTHRMEPGRPGGTSRARDVYDAVFGDG